MPQRVGAEVGEAKPDLSPCLCPFCLMARRPYMYLFLGDSDIHAFLTIDYHVWVIIGAEGTGPNLRPNQPPIKAH